MSNLKTVITGSGSYIPPGIKKNTDFTNHSFFTEHGEAIETPSTEIVEKFKDITGIEERRYTSSEVNASDMATIAAKKAIEDAALDPETLDQIIVAHNFGNVLDKTIQTDVLPALASRVKHDLGIKTQIVWLTIFYLVAQDGYKA